MKKPRSIEQQRAAGLRSLVAAHGSRTLAGTGLQRTRPALSGPGWAVAAVLYQDRFSRW